MSNQEANNSLEEKLREEEELNSNTFIDNNKKNKDHNEGIGKPLTDSELNGLAAKQIKAELMGNKVST